MLPDREPRRIAPRRLHAVESQLITPEQLKREKNAAVLKVIDTLEETTGPVWQSPVHEYVKEEFAVVARARGLQGLLLPSTQEVAEVTLSPDELQIATEAVFDHDEMTALERQQAGLPMGDDGLPIVADVAACMAYLDELDPELPGYKLENYFQGECSYSCNCHNHPSNPHINPVHRRDNLYGPRSKEGITVDYDPEGADSGRVKALRDKWRTELDYRNRGARAELRSSLAVKRNAGEPDKLSASKATDFGKTKPDAVDVDPLPRYVQSRRDEKRGLQGRPSTVPERERPILEAEQVFHAQQSYRDLGREAPSAATILGLTTADPEPNTDRKGLSGLLKKVTGRRTEEKPRGTITPSEANQLEKAIKARLGFKANTEETTNAEPLEIEAGPSDDQHIYPEVEAIEINPLDPHMLPAGFTVNEWGLPVQVEKNHITDKYMPPSDAGTTVDSIYDKYGLNELNDEQTYTLLGQKAPHEVEE